MAPSGEADHGSRFRELPSITTLVEELTGAAPEPVLIAVARRAVDLARARIKRGETVAAPDVEREARSLLAEREAGLLQPVINATGVLIHTNLGRVPLGEKQIEAIRRIATSYSNLEFDLTTGSRGTRYAHARSLLTTLTGAEAGVVVNNNAAAVLIVLAALCAGREVVVSRGELIEIGGEFRLPDVMAASGARLVEVGTTNRTHIRDYETAISPDTAALMKVHPSNYKVVGFTAEVSARDLARLARGRGVPFIHDLGSGLLEGADAGIATGEPSVQAALEDGADLVTMSGDKLLGGPQAGIILGRAELVERVIKHPLMRALRVDKLTLAALEATLAAYLDGSARDHPLWKLALASADELESRAHRLTDSIASRTGDSFKIEAVPTGSVTGGGSLPGTELPSWGLRMLPAQRSADSLERSLRSGSPPIVGRIIDDYVVLDLRCVVPADDEKLADLVVLALQE